MAPYDWHYDRDNDGKLDFFEQYEMDDDLDRMSRRGYYAENELGIDNPDDFELDDDDDFGDDNGFGDDD